MCTRRTRIIIASIAMCASNLLAANDKSQPEAGQPQAEILHWWSSPGESAALDVLINAFEARGGHYYDSTKENEDSSREEAIERMGKGYPATLTQWNAGRDILAFHDYGITDSITDPKLIEKLTSSLPKSILDTITSDGKIIAMPVNIHSENWMWYSTELIKYSDKLVSEDWQALINVGESLAKKEGIPLLAVGDQSWQVRILFTSVFLGISRERYKEFYLGIPPSVDVVNSQEFKHALQVFGQIAKLSRSFGDGNWNTQVKAVADQKAGATFMGDWAKGEFQSLGQTAGKEYGCALTGGNDPSLLLVIDAFILGKMTDPMEKAGQSLMLDLISDPTINKQFNKLKGSVSPFVKPEDSELDVCSKQVYRTLDKENAVIPPYATYQHGQAMHDIDNEIFRFWRATQELHSDSDAEVEISIKKFEKIIESIRERTTQSLANIDE